VSRFFLCLLFLCPSLAFGQAYPAKPVRVIVPFPPGGTTDVVARLVVARAGEKLGQPVVVDNVAGASGQIGTNAGIRAPNDGYVLTLGNNQTHAANAALFPNAGVDLAKDVTPLARLVRSRHAIVVPAASPYRTLRELVDGGRVRPLNYASSSPGSSSQLVSEILRLQNGMQLTHVPYKGAAPAVLAVIAGQVDFMTASLGSVAQHLAGGKLRALAVSGERRDPAMPAVPTLAELGMDALSADVWIALFAPAGTPAQVGRRWSEALGEVMRLEDTREKLAAAGFEPWFLHSAEAAAFHRDEVPRWMRMVRESGLKID
jgi:tripartite-type tricarboxylate transporter receptor subunit TctC